MKHAAKKCRKLKSGCICYSHESVIWITREQIYKSLVGYHLGRNKNRGNLKRAARKQGIKNPFQISMTELKTRLEVCEERNNYFRKNGARYRKKHRKTVLYPKLPTRLGHFEFKTLWSPTVVRLGIGGGFLKFGNYGIFSTASGYAGGPSIFFRH